MTIAISMGLICICSFFLAIALKKSVEEIIPVSLFSVVLIIFPFYCLDLLFLGKTLVYVIMMLASVLSLIYIKKQGIHIATAFLKRITPGIVLYAFVSIYFLFYLRNNLVGLWDELRLWGAVPKALYYSDKLQLGDDAFIFDIMQSYPPGVPLLIYFLTAFASSFAEYHIFVGYAILFSGVFVPALAKLKWKQWYLFVPLAVLIVFLPCLFTSHGGDFGLFYNSLFIDSLLGVLMGYVFYLASKNPLKSNFAFVQFLISVSFVILTKDSAISSAVIAVICAILIYYQGNKGMFNHRIVKKCCAAIFSLLFPYIMWNVVLHIHSITNHLSMDITSVTVESFITLMKAFLKIPMLDISVLNNTVSFSFAVCLLIMLVAFGVINKRLECLSRAPLRITFSGMFLSFVIFSVGYLCIFPRGLPSYQRYYSTILCCYLAFIMLHILTALIEYQLRKTPSFRLISFKTVFSVVLSALIAFGAVRYFESWKLEKYDGGIYDTAQTHANSIMQAVPVDSDHVQNVYLLISHDPHSNALLHHRIYFDLIGANIRVANFYNDTNIVGGLYTPEGYTDSDIDDITLAWTTQLIEKNYDYIYVISSDALACNVFECLSAEKPETGNLYRITPSNDGLCLTLINN